MPDPEDRIPDSPEEGSRAPPAGGRDSGERRAEPDRAARDADDRLRELTEQSLHLLDELAAARAALRAAEAVAEEGRARRVELEGRVAELQRQVRHSHTSRLLPAPSADAPPAFDTFLWIGDDTAAEDRDQWLAATAEWLAGSDASLVCPPAQQPSAALLAQLPRLRVLECEGGCPAQLWNLVVASATAPAIVVLAPGARPRSLAELQRLAAFDDPAVAMVQPVISVGGESPSLGLFTSRDLGVRRRPLPGSAGGVIELEALAPEAFVLRRAACLRLGAFDEDLVGTGALQEYVLRARSIGMRCIGVADVTVDIPPHLRLVEGDGARERDRLVILARHRPQELYSALASFDLFWDLPEGELQSWVRALLRRLPDAQQSPSAIEMLVAEAVALARQTVPVAYLEENLERIEQVRKGVARGTADDVDAQQRSQVRRRDRPSLAVGHEHRRKVTARFEQIAQGMAELVERDVELQAAAARLAQAEVEKQELASTLREQRDGRKRSELELERVAAETKRLQTDVAALRTELAERERWIVALLEEKVRRRLNLRPRLLEHEQRFLAQHRAARGP